MRRKVIRNRLSAIGACEYVPLNRIAHRATQSHRDSPVTTAMQVAIPNVTVDSETNTRVVLERVKIKELFSFILPPVIPEQKQRDLVKAVS